MTDETGPEYVANYHANLATLADAHKIGRAHV